MGSNEWLELPFDEAVVVNPSVPLKRGNAYPFVDMQSVMPFARNVGATEIREYSGGGARFQIGDTLMARITPSLENGKISRYTSNSEEQYAHGSTEFIVIRGREGVTTDDYAYYLTIWDDVRLYAISQMTGSSGRQRVPASAFNNIAIPLPPLPEQRAIAAVLGVLDDKIELNRRMNGTLEAMARALFKSWFVDFDPVRAKMEGRDTGLPAEIEALFPGEMEDGRPRGWGVNSIEDVIEVNPPRYLKKGQPSVYLDMANMPTDSALALDTYIREYGSGMRFQNNDTLVARITPCLENGKTCFVTFLEESQIGWGSTEYIVLRPKDPLPSEFAYFLARDTRFRDHAIQNMTGTSGRQRVPVDSIKQFQIVVPSKEVANRFGQFARDVIRTMKANSDQSHTLATLRDALLPKLMSGEVRVSQVEPEAANAL